MITLSRTELVHALEQVKGSVAQKNFVPILTHVLFSGDTVLGYDSEVGVRVKLTKPVPTFNVRASVFLDLLKALEAEDVVITVTEAKVTVKCGSHKSTLAQVTEEYPKPSVVIKDSDWCAIPSSFREALERALVAVAENENNKLLSCVYLGGSNVLGGDGRQLVRCSLKEMKVPPMLLSRRAVGEILRLGNPVRVGLAGTMAVFDFGNLLFLARLREGESQYPVATFKQMLDADRPVTEIPGGIVNAMRRLSLFTSDAVKLVSFHFGPDKLLLSTAGPTADGEEDFAPVAGGPWEAVQHINSELAVPLLQFASSWGPATKPKEPVYFSGDTAEFEALLAQSIP